MKVAFVDYRIADTEKNSLKNLGIEPFIVPPNNIVYEAVCGHPDILLHIINDNTLLVNKAMDENFISSIKAIGFEVVLSESYLQAAYPLNVSLNAVSLGNLFVHNLKYTDKTLLNIVKGKKLKNVKQGYTKCSTAIVSNLAVMTSDKRIAKTFKEENIDVLLLPPGDIVLPGLDYGFIGGTCGLLEKGLLAFYGSLENYAFGSEVLNFLRKHKVEPVFLSDGKLMDRGSILSLEAVL